MAGEPVITIIGNVAKVEDLAYSPSGMARISFSVASTPRVKDRTSDEWVDGETMWVRVTAFRSDAENAAESLKKGTRVIVQGRLSQEAWEDKEGNKRTSLKLIADEIGVSTKWKTVKVAEAERSSTAPKRNDDPWSTPTTDEDIPF